MKESGFKLQENVPVLKSILNDSTETKKDFSIEENQNCKMQETIMRFGTYNSNLKHLINLIIKI